MEEQKRKIIGLIVKHSEEHYSEFEDLEQSESDSDDVGTYETYIETDVAIAIINSELEEKPVELVTVPAWFKDWITRTESVSRPEQVFYLSHCTRPQNKKFTLEQNLWIIRNQEFAIRAILDGCVGETE